MIDNDLSEMDISDGEQKISLRRGPGERGPVVVAGPAVAPQQSPEDEAKPGDDLIEITSPMVGTFYAAPSPDSDPYVALGDGISSDTVVCVVEAMKVMNEIKAECSGTIAEICIQNAQPVEFGQVLFRVRPN